MKLQPLVMIGLASVLVTAPVSAQGAAAGAPTAVAQRVLGALASRDAAAFSRDMHPEVLAAFKSAVLRALENARTDEDKAQAATFFQGVTSFEQIAQLPPDRFFTAYMGGVFRRMREAGDLRMAYAVLGTVPEGADLVHVVYRGRMTSGAQSISDVGILTVRRSPGGWKAILSGELRSLAGPGYVAP